MSRTEISDAPGLTHLRHALRRDVSYDWEGSAKVRSDWPYALQFMDGQRRATILLAPKNRVLSVLGRESGITMRVKLAEGLQVYFDQLVRQVETGAEE